MEPTAEEVLAQHLAQLPEDVRQAVLGAEWEERVHNIGGRHKLHVDQVGILGDDTLMAMLGMVPLEQYPSKLTADLGISAGEAAAIAKEVSDEVFIAIRESLKAMHAKTEPAAPEKSPGGGVPPSAPAGGGAKDFLKELPAQPVPPVLPAPASVPKPDLSNADAALSTTKVQALDPYREPPV